MNKLLKEIEELKNEIDSLFPSKEWDKKYLEKVKIDFTYQNNKIENNSISYGQTLLYLKNATTPKNVSFKDCLDIKNHYEIIDAILKSYSIELSEKIVLDLHSKLMKDFVQWNTADNYSPGKYKWDTNYTELENGKIHWFMDYRQTPGAVKDLIQNINERLKSSDSKSIETHPLTTVTYFHNRFLEIHPFADGNGRISRIFVNNILIKKGYSPIFIKDCNRSYYLSLFQKSNSNHLEPMLSFFGEQLKDSLITKKQMILERLNITEDNKASRKRGRKI